jgi:hypothetical protein
MMVSTIPCVIHPSSLSTTGNASATMARSSRPHAAEEPGSIAGVGAAIVSTLTGFWSHDQMQPEGSIFLDHDWL